MRYKNYICVLFHMTYDSQWIMIFNMFILNNTSYQIDTTVGLLYHVNTFHAINYIVHILFRVMHFSIKIFWIYQCICNRTVESNLLWLAFFNKWIRNCKYVILPYKHIKHRKTHLQFLKMLGCKFAHIQIVFSHFSCCDRY